MGELYSPEPFGDCIKRLAHLLSSIPLLMLPLRKHRSKWLLESCSASRQARGAASQRCADTAGEARLQRVGDLGLAPWA